jgi:hypothetical protein
MIGQYEMLVASIERLTSKAASPFDSTQGLEPLGHELEAEWLRRNGCVGACFLLIRSGRRSATSLPFLGRL